MISKEDLKRNVYDIIDSHSGEKMSDSLLDSNFIVDFGEDSLDIVEQCMELESTYGITMDYLEVKKCTTPRNLIDITYRKISEKEGIPY